MPRLLNRYKFIALFLGCTLGISYFIATRIGLFELPDGFFYYNLGNFILHRPTIQVLPFNATIPQTLYGPLYSIFLAYVIGLPYPWGITLIPFIQLLLVGLAIFLTIDLIRKFIGKSWQIPGFLLLFAMPFLLVYATTLMSEAVTFFLATLYSYLFIVIIAKKTKLSASVLVFVACILTLTKNAYIVGLALSLPVWILDLWRRKDTLTPIKGLLWQIPLIIGLIGIVAWIRFNKTYQDEYALTNYTGRHLYNNVVHQGKLLPDSSEPIYKEFLSRLGDPQNFYLIEYEVQRFFIADFNNHTLTESQIDKKFLSLSIAAIKKQPLAYIGNVLIVAWGDVTTPPYQAGILEHLNSSDCRINWNGDLCAPSHPNSIAQHIWASFIQAQNAFYPLGMAFLFLLALIGTLSAVWKRNIALISSAGIFFLFLFLQAGAQEIEGRYIIPSYAVYTLIILNGVKTVIAEIMPVVRKKVVHSNNS